MKFIFYHIAKSDVIAFSCFFAIDSAKVALTVTSSAGNRIVMWCHEADSAELTDLSSVVVQFDDISDKSDKGNKEYNTKVWNITAISSRKEAF